MFGLASMFARRSFPGGFDTLGETSRMRDLIDDAGALVSVGLFLSTVGLWLSIAGA